MGERKVLNKYYPPDFDPAKIPRRKQPKNLQMKVRMMLPMSIRCTTCGNYIYKGTKFNCRKEDVVGETYLGILIFRFYFKCTKCSAELIMKTDPQNSDYIMESGASRNFEPWRQKDEAVDSAKKERETEEMGDAMKALENRTLDSKQEMDIMAALDEMKSMRARQASIDTAAMLGALRQSQEQPSTELREEDEALIKSVVFRNSANFVHRLKDDDEEAHGPQQSTDRVAGAPPTQWLDTTNGLNGPISSDINPNPKRPRLHSEPGEPDRVGSGGSMGTSSETSRPPVGAATPSSRFHARPPKPAAFVVKPKAAQASGSAAIRVQDRSIAVKTEQEMTSSDRHVDRGGISSAPLATAVLSSLSAYGSDDED